MIRRLLILTCSVALLAGVAEARTWHKMATTAECHAACTPNSALFASVCAPLPRNKAQRCQTNLVKVCRRFGTQVCTTGSLTPIPSCDAIVADATATCTADLAKLNVAYNDLLALFNACAPACGLQPIAPTTTTTTVPTTVTTLPGPPPGVGTPCERNVDCQSTDLVCRGNLHHKRCQLRPLP